MSRQGPLLLICGRIRRLGERFEHAEVEPFGHHRVRPVPRDVGPPDKRDTAERAI
jgi:hypothetical protein